MTCEAYQELASQFIDGELLDERSGALFSHLSSCTACRQFMHSTLQIHYAVLQSPVLSVPPTLEARVKRMRIVRGPGRVPFRTFVEEFWKRRLLVPVPAFVSAGVVMLLVIALSIASLTRVPAEVRDAMTRSAFLVTLPAVEVQGTYPIEQKSVH
jgi:anti-sigma factor RsiW